jgi:hypothetical protein
VAFKQHIIWHTTVLVRCLDKQTGKQMLHNPNGYKISPAAAQAVFDSRFFPLSGPVDFPYLSDLLGADWVSGQNNAIAYRNNAQAMLNKIYS